MSKAVRLRLGAIDTVTLRRGLKLLLDIKEKAVRLLPRKSIFKTKDQIVQGHQIETTAGPGKQVIGQCCIVSQILITGIILNIAHVKVSFEINGQRDVSELLQRHVFPAPRTVKDSFFESRFVERIPWSLDDVDF